MRPLTLDEPTNRYLTFEEREEIAILYAKEMGVREIARTVGRDPSTISRELRRNAATRDGDRGYRAGVAQWKAQEAAKRPKVAKLASNPRLRQYVEDRLAGVLRDEDGRLVPGPDTPACKGVGQAPQGGPQVVHRVEPGADIAAVEDRLPAMMRA